MGNITKIKMKLKDADDGVVAKNYYFEEDLDNLLQDFREENPEVDDSEILIEVYYNGNDVDLVHKLRESKDWKLQ